MDGNRVKTSDCITGVFLKGKFQTTTQLQNSGIVRQMKKVFEKPPLASFFKIRLGYSPEFCFKKECWNAGLSPELNIYYRIHSSPVKISREQHSCLLSGLGDVLINIFIKRSTVVFKHIQFNVSRFFIDMIRTNFSLTYSHIFRMSNSTFTKDNYPSLAIIDLIPPIARILISKLNHYIQTGWKACH